jgi:uncharacterized protein (TIGR02246 family)
MPNPYPGNIFYRSENCCKQLQSIEQTRNQGEKIMSKSIEIKEAEISKLFDRWNQSLQSRNPDRVIANYATDAILLPTGSNLPRTNDREIRDYFEHFLKLKPVAVINMRVIRISSNLSMDSGLYTFTLIKNGKKIEVPARYTFEYQKIDGQWLIVGHHSSIMPEQLSSCTKLNS